jgi:hypothetical protein
MPAAACSSAAGGTVLKKHNRSTKSSKRWTSRPDDATDVAAGDRAPVVTEHVVDERARRE